MWSCPLCSCKLTKANKTWSCANRHTFDEAKSGYVNLLPVHHKHSLEPGDNKQMVNARRNFHASEGYILLMQKLSNLVEEYANANALTEVSLFEAGCGEGSYLATLAHYLKKNDLRVRSTGVDISKPAVELAAKSFKDCHFAVASNFRLPLPADSQHVILQIFAPGDMTEYARVLRQDGIVISVDPGKDHLWELKEQIYQTPRQHRLSQQKCEDYALINSQSLTFEVSLDDEIRKQGLLAMTPYAWKLSEEKRAQLEHTLSHVTAEFTINVWQHVTSIKEGGEHAQ